VTAYYWVDVRRSQHLIGRSVVGVRSDLALSSSETCTGTADAVRDEDGIGGNGY